jgi:hypothetical protein
MQTKLTNMIKMHYDYMIINQEQIHDNTYVVIPRLIAAKIKYGQLNTL